MHISNLWVVMPVYNEEEALGSVVEEWQQALLQSGVPYTLCILNDGSKDNTAALLREYAAKYPQIKVVDKPNSGHGQTCMTGYRLAMENDADWVFQIDSDGQCSPQYFPEFVDLAKAHKAIYGYRKTRDDGFKRRAISRFVSLFTYAATGIWLRDANVPYRFIHADIMKRIVHRIPADFFLANIYVSVLTRRQTPIRWVNIHFRDRSGGSPSLKTFSFVKHGLRLFSQLRGASRS